MINRHLPKTQAVILLVAFLVATGPCCRGQFAAIANAPALVITNSLCQMAAGDALQYFRDPSRQAVLSQILAIRPESWTAFKPGIPTSFGFTADAFWLRLRLRCALPESCETVVELDNSRIERVDWFALRNGNVMKRELAGNQHPFTGPVPRPRGASFRLKLAPGEELDVYARVESRSAIIVPFLVYGSPEVQANEAARRDWLALAGVGFFGSLFCTSIFLGAILRNRLHLINALIALLLCGYYLLVDGSWGRLGLPFASELVMQPTMFLLVTMDCFVGLFMWEFIPSRLRGCFPSRFQLAIVLVALAGLLVVPFLPYRTNFRLVALISVAVMGSCSAVAWWLHRRHTGGGTRLLLLAWLTNLGVVFVIILELTGAIPAWLPQTAAPLLYGLTISGLYLAASTHRAHELMHEQVRTFQLEKSLAESRLLALRYQVNPHFLFNSLNSAIALVQHEPARVAPFLYRLADFLRAALRADRSLTVPLAEEMGNLSAYLEVEKVRFEQRLEVNLEVSSELDQCQVPELILQPLVENAIKHGMSQSTTALHIRIRAECEEEQLRLEVANTGRLIPDAAPGKVAGGVGLANLRERLRLLYQNRASLSLTQADGWVFARLSLPVTKPQGN
jgi:anti-sigma regulatory factor (Ser/Thr protein kinase)